MNLADFFTKAHPVHHHFTMQNFYVVEDKHLLAITSSEGVLE